MMNIVYLKLVLLATSVTAAISRSPSCFVPTRNNFPPSSAMNSPARTSMHNLNRGRASTELSLSMRSKRRDSATNKYRYKSRLPRHRDEAAGITSGLGLWREIRQRVRKRARRKKQQLFREKWITPTYGKRRRRNLNLRLQKMMGNEEEEEEVNDENEFNEFNLDDCIARAGVLRTGIRLKQDELKDLANLMKDLELELKRMEIQRQRMEEQGSDERNFDDEEDDEMESLMNEFQLDLMQKRSAELQSIILLDRIKLQNLERRITCFESSELGILETYVGNALDILNDIDNPFADMDNPFAIVQRQSRKFANTFGESTSVLIRKIDRVSTKSGSNNRNYSSVTDFVVQETAAGVRIVGSLLSNPDQLSHLLDPETPTLVAHVPAILTRLDRLESHVAPILSRVLNNKQHLRTIEPYLPEILERFDDIEPHLPWILDHIDTLAPYTGLLLKHIDELLLYAEVDERESEGDKDNYAFAEQLLPYLEVYVSQLDLVGPHLPLLRPHLPMLLKHNRIKILSPHVGKLFAKGYTDLSASANMDILLFWFGWALRIPFVPRIFFSFPGSPGTVSFLANRLPKRLVRGRCADISCYCDGDYGGEWNTLSKESETKK